jgi:RNA polymerase sigma-70 factor, ECF subfamily
VLLNETELIASIVRGNKEAFRQIVEQYQGMVFRTANGFVHNSDDANDIAQEVFIGAYQSLKNFKGESTLSTWIYRITINASLLHLKRSSKRSLFQQLDTIMNSGKSKDSLLLPKDDSHPENILEDKQRAEVLHRAINSLPENQRIAFTLNKYDDLSYKEISDIMKLSIPAIESLLHRAREGLQKKLKNFYKNY